MFQIIHLFFFFSICKQTTLVLRNDNIRRQKNSIITNSRCLARFVHDQIHKINAKQRQQRRKHQSLPIEYTNSRPKDLRARKLCVWISVRSRLFIGMRFFDRIYVLCTYKNEENKTIEILSGAQVKCAYISKLCTLDSQVNDHFRSLRIGAYIYIFQFKKRRSSVIYLCACIYLFVKFNRTTARNHSVTFVFNSILAITLNMWNDVDISTVIEHIWIRWFNYCASFRISIVNVFYEYEKNDATIWMKDSSKIIGFCKWSSTFFECVVFVGNNEKWNCSKKCSDDDYILKHLLIQICYAHLVWSMFVVFLACLGHRLNHLWMRPFSMEPDGCA